MGQEGGITAGSCTLGRVAARGQSVQSGQPQGRDGGVEWSVSPCRRAIDAFEVEGRLVVAVTFSYPEPEVWRSR
jgi:hypothetical protein